MLADIIRKVVPINVRQDLGLWTATQAGRSKWFAYPYFWILCGEIPKNLKLLPNRECSVNYNKSVIIAPRDAIFTFMEVLQSETYEKYWTPKSTDVVLDVGAYVGMFSVKMASKVKQVIAIEPSSSNYNYLVLNVARFSNITTVGKAAWFDTGSVRLYLSGASACHTLNDRHEKFELVQADTLDNITQKLGYGQVDFIKIDAEGAELDILQGADSLLSGNVKVAIAAYHNLQDGKPEKKAVIELLKSFNFEVKDDGNYVYGEHSR